METVAQSVHINYFCYFILNKLLTFYFIHIQLNVVAIGLATVHTFLHSVQHLFTQIAKLNLGSLSLPYENNT